MEDTAIKNARERFNEISSTIASLEGKIAELREEREHIEKFIEMWHAFAAVPIRMPPAKDEDGDHRESRKEPVKRATGNPKKEVVAEAAREIIAERREPVPRSDLFKALTDRGIILQGADPEMVLSTMLWRMRDRVVRVRGGGYWLAEVPYPDAGYEPGVDHTGFDSLLNKPVDEVREPHPDDIELLDRIANDIEDGDE
jgi:hypothetical protein